jgi:hypothetical protein
MVPIIKWYAKTSRLQKRFAGQIQAVSGARCIEKTPCGFFYKKPQLQKNLSRRVFQGMENLIISWLGRRNIGIKEDSSYQRGVIREELSERSYQRGVIRVQL